MTKVILSKHCKVQQKPLNQCTNTIRHVRLSARRLFDERCWVRHFILWLSIWLQRYEEFLECANYLQFFRMESPKSYARMGRAEALVARWFNRGPQRRLRLFARMGRGGAMERFISVPKSFSEVRDDECYQPLRPKCRMRSTAVPSRNAQSPWEQIVRSEAKIRKGEEFLG